MDFRLLGPLEVVDEGRLLELGRPKQRAVLALLLLRANEVVSADWLVRMLWGDRPPATARTVLHGHVSRLRRLLGAGRLRRVGAGYLFAVAPEELDLHRCERLVAAARTEPEAATRLRFLRGALGVWRGQALAEFAGEPFADLELRPLEELWFEALEERIEAELELGLHGGLVAELERVLARDPLRERLRGQLALVLYRSGCQVKALEVCRDGRALLSAELGLDPHPALQRLERQILRHDPELEHATAFRRQRPAEGGEVVRLPQARPSAERTLASVWPS